VNAEEWLASGAQGASDVVVIGAPISRASISPSRAQETPAAFRNALRRFPTWEADSQADLTELRIRDLGDVGGDAADTDAKAAHARIEAAAAEAAAQGSVVAVIGGDNSLTRPAMAGMAAGALADGWGLLTFDAHHDVRPLAGAPSNGNPVRGLIEAGLPGHRIAQIGISGLGNAREHAEWAAAQGVHVRRASLVRELGMARVLSDVLAVLADAGVTRLYVDVDLDVLDRTFAPACPASLPGGLTPQHLLEAALMLGADPRLRAFDLVEVDASADVAATTVCTMAAVFLAFCAGMTLLQAPP
jgi:arginase family enzyme